MKKQPLVSVIIPTFNAAKYLSQTIESALNQSHKNIEVIVVDDGSADDTEKLVKKYPVKYIRIKHSGGAAVPRNLGVQNAKGDLIAFLDADDIWLTKKLEEEVKFMQEERFDLVHCDGEVINEVGKTVKNSFHQGATVPSGRVFADLHRGNFIVASSVLVRRICFDKVGWFDRKMHVIEDYDLWLRMSRYFSFGFLNKKLLKYREYAGSFSDEGVIKNHERLLAVWRKNYPYARKVLDGEARYRIYELCKFLARNSKGTLPLKYLRYKLFCLSYFSPSEIKRRGMSLTEEIKGLVKL